jgi:hypothetical protein
MLDVLAALQRHQRATGGAPLGISRASWLHDVAKDVGAVAIPVVAGQTVWTAGPAECTPVVEQPNWFGRIERTPSNDTRAATILWWEHAPTGDGVVVEAFREAGTVPAARNLAGQLRQIRGVGLPHGQPDSPWFIVSLPGDSSNVAKRLHAASFVECQSLGIDFPEFPGGLRIPVAWPPTENERFAQIVLSALED